MTTDETKYLFTPDMDEISGLGGDYEACCREALRGALLYLDANPGPELVAQEIPGVFGIVTGNERLDAAIAAGNAAAVARFGEECGLTGAMVHAITNCLLFIQKRGWDAFRVAMLKDGGAA